MSWDEVVRDCAEGVGMWRWSWSCSVWRETANASAVAGTRASSWPERRIYRCRRTVRPNLEFELSTFGSRIVKLDLHTVGVVDEDLV
jgi:hypothetical protein